MRDNYYLREVRVPKMNNRENKKADIDGRMVQVRLIFFSNGKIMHVADIRWRVSVVRPAGKCFF